MGPDSCSWFSLTTKYLYFTAKTNTNSNSDSSSKSSESEEGAVEITTKGLVGIGMITRSTLSEDDDVIGFQNTTPEPRTRVILRTVGDIVQMSPIFFIGISVIRAFLNLIFAKI